MAYVTQGRHRKEQGNKRGTASLLSKMGAGILTLSLTGAIVMGVNQTPAEASLSRDQNVVNSCLFANQGTLRKFSDGTFYCETTAAYDLTVDRSEGGKGTLPKGTTYRYYLVEAKNRFAPDGYLPVSGSSVAYQIKGSEHYECTDSPESCAQPKEETKGEENEKPVEDPKVDPDDKPKDDSEESKDDEVKNNPEESKDDEVMKDPEETKEGEPEESKDDREEDPVDKPSEDEEGPDDSPETCAAAGKFFNKQSNTCEEYSVCKLRQILNREENTCEEPPTETTEDQPQGEPEKGSEERLPDTPAPFNPPSLPTVTFPAIPTPEGPLVAGVQETPAAPASTPAVPAVIPAPQPLVAGVQETPAAPAPAPRPAVLAKTGALTTEAAGMALLLFSLGGLALVASRRTRCAA